MSLARESNRCDLARVQASPKARRELDCTGVQSVWAALLQVPSYQHIVPLQIEIEGACFPYWKVQVTKCFVQATMMTGSISAEYILRRVRKTSGPESPQPVLSLSGPSDASRTSRKGTLQCSERQMPAYWVLASSPPGEQAPEADFGANSSVPHPRGWQPQSSATKSLVCQYAG